MLKNKALIKIFCSGFILVLTSCNQTSTNNITEDDIQQLNQAAGLMGQYQFQSAVEILSPIHKKFPENITVSLDLAVAILNRQQQGDIEQAIKLANQVNLIDAGNLRANYLLGILYLYQGQAKRAIHPLRQVLKNDLKDAYAEYFLAQAFEQLGDFEAAYLHYSKSVKLLPYLRSASYAAAMTARKLGQKQQAKIHLEVYKKLKNNPRALLAEYKYTRMGKLAEISIINDEHQSPQKFSPKLAQWKSHLEIGGNHLNHFAVIQRLQPKLETEVINFSSIDKSSNNTINGSDIQLSEFPLSAITHSALADINNDGITDAVTCSEGVWQLFLQDSTKNWESQDIFPIMHSQTQFSCGAVKLFDADHDGDVDIYIANFQGADELFSNNGNMTFRRLSENWQADNANKTVQVIPLDWDHDRDLDILLLKQNGELRLLENHLLWNYQTHTIELPNPIAIKKLLVIDTNSDGSLELITLDSEQLLLWEKDKNLIWRSKVINDQAQGYENLLLEDFEGDGLLDLVLFGTNGIRWQPLFDPEKAQQLTKNSVIQLSIIANSFSKSPKLLSLEGSSKKQQLKTYFESANHAQFTYLQLQGADDTAKSLRSNFQAIGTEVRGRVGSRWIIPSTFTANSQSGQNVIPKILSTQGNGKLDFIEIRWPDGVFQTELDIEAGEKIITETQRQLSSCPVLFVETDSGYQFVSDILGVGGVGFLAEPGEYVESRPWEYFLLPQHLIKPGSDKIRLIITEPMEENTYLDSIQMHRYRLPQGWKMVMDERMGVSEPLPTGEALFYQHSYKANQVLDGMGNDVSNFLKEADNNPAPIGKLHSQYVGLVEQPQQLILYFPQIKALQLSTQQLGLVIDGWVEYPYSQTVFAAWQAGERYQAPTIDVLVNNQWQTLHSEIGYPAGMPRKAFFPLTGLPKDTTAIRISTNLELYFDAIHLVVIEPPPAHSKVTANLSSAKMEYSGFPERSNAASNRPVYNFQKRTPYADMKTLTGDFTRFGEISELLEKEDNAFAIIGSGDSVAVEFQFNTRDNQAKALDINEYYVLEARGYAKDMDLYTDTGGTVTPIPLTKLSKTINPITKQKNQSVIQAKKLHDAYNTRYQDGW